MENTCHLFGTDFVLPRNWAEFFLSGGFVVVLIGGLCFNKKET